MNDLDIEKQTREAGDVEQGAAATPAASPADELAKFAAEPDGYHETRSVEGRTHHVLTLTSVGGRADEILEGGSLYWVFKGLVLARQRIVAFDRRTGADGIARCAIGFDPELTRNGVRLGTTVINVGA